MAALITWGEVRCEFENGNKIIEGDRDIVNIEQMIIFRRLLQLFSLSFIRQHTYRTMRERDSHEVRGYGHLSSGTSLFWCLL